MNENNFLKRKTESISQSNVVNQQATKSGGYCEVKLDAMEQTTNSNNHDPSLFEDAYDDNERQISGLNYYSALQILSSSASNNAFIRNINIGNDDHKQRFSKSVASYESWVADKDDSGRTMTQLSNLSTMQDRVTLTKQTSKAFAQELAGNLASTRRPFTANDTLKSLAVVPPSNSFMPKTDIRNVPLKSCDMGFEIRATAANHEAKHNIVKSENVPMTEKEKEDLVFSHALIYDTNFSRNLHAILSSSEKMNGVTFVGDHEITDADILSGRGGKSNHHVGNKRFRHLVSEMKSMYRSAGQKTDKTALSRGIIEYVHSYRGRFLIQDGTANDRQWRVMTTMEARKKTSQALRETKVLKWTLESSPNFQIAST
jgi:hypothetical protein